MGESGQVVGVDASDSTLLGAASANEALVDSARVKVGVLFGVVFALLPLFPHPTAAVRFFNHNPPAPFSASFAADRRHCGRRSSGG